MKISRSFTVSPAPEVVRAYLLDFAHAEHWDPGTKSCERIDSGPVQVGSRWHNVSRFLGRTAELTYTLVRADPDHLVFEGANDAATSTDDLRITHAEDGSRIAYSATITLRSRFRVVLEPLMTLPMRRIADQTVERMSTTLNGLS